MKLYKPLKEELKNNKEEDIKQNDFLYIIEQIKDLLNDHEFIIAPKENINIKLIRTDPQIIYQFVNDNNSQKINGSIKDIDINFSFRFIAYNNNDFFSFITEYSFDLPNIKSSSLSHRAFGSEIYFTKYPFDISIKPLKQNIINKIEKFTRYKNEVDQGKRTIDQFIW